MKLYSSNENYKLYQGNMLDMLEVIEPNTIDSVVCDPPYGLTSITKRFGKENSAPAQFGTDGAFNRLSKGFMGKEWDGSEIEYNIDTWEKCYEVLKPGGYLLAFGGSRTFHRIAVAIEDAGFEIRDTIMWLYGSGFPSDNKGQSNSRYFYCAKASKKDRDEGIKEYYQIILNKEDYKCEENMELVQLLQKVISGLEVENLNILEHGKNIMVIFPKECKSTILTEINKITELKTWNLLIQSLTKDYIVDASCETTNGGNLVENVENLKELKQTITNENQELVLGVNNVVYQMLLKIKEEENWKVANNSHCTVKPTELMQYLIRLVTPNGGTILDPFNGSGSTGKAVMYENREKHKDYKYIGIELTEEYLPIAKARIEYVCNLKEEKPDKEQLSLFD